MELATMGLTAMPRRPEARFMPAVHAGAAVTFGGPSPRWSPRSRGAVIRDGSQVEREASRQASRQDAARLIHAFFDADDSRSDAVDLQALLALSLDCLERDTVRLAAIEMFLHATMRPTT